MQSSQAEKGGYYRQPRPRRTQTGKYRHKKQKHNLFLPQEALPDDKNKPFGKAAAANKQPRNNNRQTPHQSYIIKNSY